MDLHLLRSFLNRYSMSSLFFSNIIIVFIFVVTQFQGIFTRFLDPRIFALY